MVLKPAVHCHILKCHVVMYGFLGERCIVLVSKINMCRTKVMGGNIVYIELSAPRLHGAGLVWKAYLSHSRSFLPAYRVPIHCIDSCKPLARGCALPFLNTRVSDLRVLLAQRCSCLSIMTGFFMLLQPYRLLPSFPHPRALHPFILCNTKHVLQRSLQQV